MDLDALLFAQPLFERVDILFELEVLGDAQGGAGDDIEPRWLAVALAKVKHLRERHICAEPLIAKLAEDHRVGVDIAQCDRP